MVSAMRSTRTLFIALSLLAVLATMAAMQVIDTRLALGVWTDGKKLAVAATHDSAASPVSNSH